MYNMQQRDDSETFTNRMSGIPQLQRYIRVNINVTTDIYNTIGSETFNISETRWTVPRDMMGK